MLETITFRQLLGVLNLFVTKRRNIGDEMDYKQVRNEDIGDLVRDTLEAKLTRSVFYHLVDLGVEHDTSKGEIFGVWSDGTFFELGNLEGVPV